MRSGEGSRTAEVVAARRAAHQLLDRPLVFEDPVAASVVSPRFAALLREDPRRLDRHAMDRYLRAMLVARSRFAEDCLREAVANGVRQYVLLGAGLDTFAYRNPFPELRVFEVDHPATQASKRRRLAAARIKPPANVTYAAADLADVPLGDALAAAGFDATQPAVFAWLGVVPYLTLPAIRATLRSIASLPRGTAVVLDYGLPSRSLPLLARLAVWWTARKVAAIGEPWISFFTQDEMRRELETAGFTTIRDLGADELNAMYFAGRGDRLRMARAARFVIATV